MEKFKEFSLPIKGLKNGTHEFNFQIDAEFFKHFENSPIENGNFDVQLKMDKRETFFELVFDFDGSIDAECDRCTAPIQLYFGDSQYLTVKYSIETQDEDAEVVFISPDSPDFNVAQYIYEFICLSVPYHKVYDCENDDPQPCDFNVLNRLNETPSVKETEKEAKTGKNPFDDLKKMFNSDN